VRRTVEWTKGWLYGRDVNGIMDAQIEEFLRASGGGDSTVG